LQHAQKWLWCNLQRLFGSPSVKDPPSYGGGDPDKKLSPLAWRSQPVARGVILLVVRNVGGICLQAIARVYI